MEPVTITVATVLAGIWVFCRAGYRAGKLPEPQPLTYDDRWSDPKYVKMVHDTIALEKKEFGEATTKCEAECCKPKPKPIPPKGPGAVVTKREIESYWYRVIGGYKFKLPSYVPADAKASIRPGLDYRKMVFCVFTWYRTDGMRMNYTSAAWVDDYVGTMEMEIVAYRNQFLSANEQRRMYPAEIGTEKVRK